MPSTSLGIIVPTLIQEGLGFRVSGLDLVNWQVLLMKGYISPIVENQKEKHMLNEMGYMAVYRDVASFCFSPNSLA